MLGERLRDGHPDSSLKYANGDPAAGVFCFPRRRRDWTFRLPLLESRHPICLFWPRRQMFTSKLIPEGPCRIRNAHFCRNPFFESSVREHKPVEVHL